MKRLPAKYEWEFKMERAFTRIWKLVINLEKYLMKTPRNKYEKWDKAFLTWSILAPITMFLFAILFR